MNINLKHIVFIILLYPCISLAAPVSSTLTGIATVDGFGWVTAISGKHALVAAPFADTQTPTTGTVFVYREASKNNWVADGSLVTTDLYANDQFGHSLSLDDNTALVGVPFQDALFTDEGAAYVFSRDTYTGTWQQTQKITPPFHQQGNQFGKSVAIDGNTMLISAWHAKSTAWDVGEAYLYHKDLTSGQWIYQQTLAPTDATNLQRFGTSVSLKGNLAVIGSYWNTVDTYSKAGSAYVFEKDPYTQAWAQTSKLVAIDRYANNFFGGSVDTNGQVIVVGARENGAAAVQAGSVYVFSKNQAGFWVQKVQLTASDAQFNDRFGRWVSITGNIIYAGALRTDYNGLTDAGSVYRFDYNQSLGQWVESYQFTPLNASSGDHIGARLDADGKRLIIGAGFGHGTPAATGNAYIYTFNSMDRLSFSEQKQLGSTPSVKQTHATIATLNSGVSMSVWAGNGGIWYRMFDRAGLPLFTERKILGTSYQDNYPDISAYKNKGFVIAWQGKTARGKEPTATVFNDQGQVISPPFIVTSNINYAYNLTDKMHPDTAMLPNGDFLVVWDTIEQGIRHVYLQQLTPRGTAVSNIIQLDSNQAYLVRNASEHGLPDIDINNLDDIFVAWSGELNQSGRTGIVYRKFNINDTNWLATPQQWLTSPTSTTTAARVMADMNNRGDIAVTWGDQKLASTKRSTKMRLYTAKTKTWTNVLPITNTSPSGIALDETFQPIPLLFNNGNIFIGCTTQLVGNTSELQGQFFNLSGQQRGPSFRLNQQGALANERLALSKTVVKIPLKINFVYEKVNTNGIASQRIRQLNVYP